MSPVDDQARAQDLEARISAKGEQAFSLAQAGRMREARDCYAELSRLVAQRSQACVRRMELERGLA